MEYNDFIRLKNSMASKLEETKIQKIESHLYYISEQIRFVKEKFDRIISRLQPKSNFKHERYT